MEDLLRQLELLTGQDVVAATEAFEKLRRLIIPVVDRSLRAFVASSSDREDVIATTLSRIWEKRTTFKIMGVGAWWAYVFTVAKRSAWASRSSELPADFGEDLAAKDDEALRSIAEWREDVDNLYRLADELWLGIAKEMPERERRKRLLAAQLFYLHDQPYDEVIAVVGAGTVDRSDLDTWLGSDPTLRDLAYNDLYVENDALAAWVLRGSPAQVTVGENSNPSNSAREGWSPSEVPVIQRRYQNGLTNDKLLQLFPEYDEPRLSTLLDKCRHMHPFASRAARIAAALRKRRVGSEPLIGSGLWKRLVFQYFASCDLPQKHIFERTEPPASVLGFHLTEGMINVWLSNGRLCAQLAKHAGGQSAN